jgi:hypothetical protein
MIALIVQLAPLIDVAALTLKNVGLKFHEGVDAYAASWMRHAVPFARRRPARIDHK